MRLIDADILFREVEESRICNPHKQSTIAQNHDCEHKHFLRMIHDSETFDIDKHDSEIRADERRKVTEWLSEVTTFDCRYCQLVHDCDKEEYKNCVGKLIDEYEKENENG